MGGMLDLWAGAGPWMYVLLIVFVVAFGVMAAQALLARKIVVPRLFSNCAVALLGTALIGMAIGYLLMFDVIFERGVAPGAALMGGKVATTSLFFGLGMIAILLALHLAAEAIGRPQPATAARITGVLAGLSWLALTLGALMLLHGKLALDDIAARDLLGDMPENTARALSRAVRTSVALNGAAVLLAAANVVVSVVAMARAGSR